MIVLDADFRQRAFDGKWERIVKTLDYDNIYEFNTGHSKKTHIPTKWIVTDVYDYIIELILENGEKY